MLFRSRATKPLSGATSLNCNKQSARFPGVSLKRFTPVACALLVVSFLVFGATKALRFSNQPVDEVIVSGVVNSSGDSIRLMIEKEIERGFWKLDLAAVQREVEQQPWVREAVVKRQWPNRIVVGVDEHVPVARWGRDRLLSATGDLFEVNDQRVFGYLPKFLCGEDALQAVVELFNGLQIALDPYELSVVELKQSPVGAWTTRLDNGVTVELGAVAEGRRLARLTQLLQTLSAKTFANVSRIDLRYPNGVAVAWRDGKPFASEGSGASGNRLIAQSEIRTSLNRGDR